MRRGMIFCLHPSTLRREVQGPFPSNPTRVDKGVTAVWPSGRGGSNPWRERRRNARRAFASIPPIQACFVKSSSRYALPGAMKRAHLHLREVHLHCDLTGFNFRSNQRIVRGVNDPEVTDRVLEAIEGKRLTYRRAHTAMHAKAKRPLRRFSNESQELPMGEFKAIQFCLRYYPPPRRNVFSAFDQ